MSAKDETVGNVLFTEQQILDKANELGEKITKDYEGEELIVVGALKGAVMWMSELIKRIDLDVKIDFVSVSSYGSGKTSSGFVTVKKDIGMDIYDKNVIIIEDIIDTGTTLKFLKERLEKRSPKSVRICTMLDKPSNRNVELKADYVGFTVDDLFIVGYGLDYDQKYRNLPYISYLQN